MKLNPRLAFNPDERFPEAPIVQVLFGLVFAAFGIFLIIRRVTVARLNRDALRALFGRLGEPSARSSTPRNIAIPAAFAVVIGCVIGANGVIKLIQ